MKNVAPSREKYFDQHNSCKQFPMNNDDQEQDLATKNQFRELMNLADEGYFFFISYCKKTKRIMNNLNHPLTRLDAQKILIHFRCRKNNLKKQLLCNTPKYTYEPWMGQFLNIQLNLFEKLQ